MKKYNYGKRYYIVIFVFLLFMVCVSYAFFALFFKALFTVGAVLGIFAMIKERNVCFIVDKEKIILRKSNKEVSICWKDVKYITVRSSISSLLTSFCIHSNENKRFFITWWLNDYKDIIKEVYEKCRTNEGFAVDIRILNMIKEDKI